jgi:hypothetical protein
MKQIMRSHFYLNLVSFHFRSQGYFCEFNIYGHGLYFWPIGLILDFYLLSYQRFDAKENLDMKLKKTSCDA